MSWYQKVHFAIFWIFWSKMKITQADAPTIWMDCHYIQTNWCPHLCHPHHFYALPHYFIKIYIHLHIRIHRRVGSLNVNPPISKQRHVTTFSQSQVISRSAQLSGFNLPVTSWPSGITALLGVDFCDELTVWRVDRAFWRLCECHAETGSLLWWRFCFLHYSMQKNFHGIIHHVTTWNLDDVAFLKT